MQLPHASSCGQVGQPPCHAAGHQACEDLVMEKETRSETSGKCVFVQGMSALSWLPWP